MAYNGSVELISGITQANNGSFPLVDASAVRVDDETRLDEALENIAGIGMRVTNVQRRSVLSAIGQTIKAIVFTVKTSVDYNTQNEGGGRKGHNLMYIPTDNELSWSDSTYTTTYYRIEIGEKLYPLSIDGIASQDTSSFTYYKGVFLLYYRGNGGFDMSITGYEATTSNQGFMSAADKTKLNALSGPYIEEPSTEGTSGQVLTTDGNGGRSWTTVQGGGGGSADIDDTAGIGATTKTWSADKLAKTDTYVTPEQFGAKGDDTTDDTTAIQNCINYAQTNTVPVRGLKRYKTTGTITISSTYLDLYIKRISYSGNGYAVEVSGGYNNLRFDSLYCTNGSCMYIANPGTYLGWNKIYGTRFYAYNHGITLSEPGSQVYYCTFDIRAIKADNGNCFNNGGGNVEECVYMNTSCDCGTGWAIYSCGGRFYNFTLEGAVLNGIYYNGAGRALFSGFRYREMVDKMVRTINGHPTSTDTGGTLIKFGPNCLGSSIKFIGDDPIPYPCIDVSDMTTATDVAEETPFVMDKAIKLPFFHIIDAPIRIGSVDTRNGLAFPAKGMIIAGGKKICIPAYESAVTITDTTYDMRDAQIDNNYAKIFPTKMVIGVDNCVIYLNDSYCSYGYSEFVVDQRSHTCTIYDTNSTSTPIFNGASLGAGIYRLKAYCDPATNIGTSHSQAQRPFNDTINYSWDVQRIDASGGSALLNYVTPEEYGAVGDGITDDSQAVQAAVNAGYDVYFASNKTYYLASTVTIDHDCHLHGGKNTVIKTKTPSGGTANDGIVVTGTLKATTTMTSDYTTNGNTACAGNRFELADMTNVDVGDILLIQATDQYFSPARQYYYLGATLLVSDKDGSYIYTSDAMPFGISNTANVSVQVYSAPTPIIENLTLMSDLDTDGQYIYLLRYVYCKNGVVKNCTFSKMDSGCQIRYCVNALFDGVNLSYTPSMGTSNDHYGIVIYSSTNTTINRVASECANSCVDLSGQIPSINTRVTQCNLFSSNRTTGLGMHENVYNTVVEDCVLGGMDGYGTLVVNRCRFVTPKKVSDSNTGITYRGNANGDMARLTVTNCTFEGDNLNITVDRTRVQNPVQSTFDDVTSEILIENCTGGKFVYIQTPTDNISSIRIKRLILRNWRNCKEIHHTTGSYIDFMLVENCEFAQKFWINNHSNQYCFDGISCLRLINNDPLQNRLFVNASKNGRRYVLPEGIPITFSSSDTSAHYVMCGNNIGSNSADDYGIGAVSGSVGGSLTRTTVTGHSSDLSTDSDGNLVCTNPGTSAVSYYLKCMVYVDEGSIASISCKLKNTGTTSGSTYKPRIAVLDADTQLITGIGEGTGQQADASGVTISYERLVEKNSFVQFYIYCNSPVTGAETTFEELTMTVRPSEMGAAPYEKYNGVSRDGDGSLNSVSGVNYVMCSTPAFNTVFMADYVSESTIPNAAGVSF